MQIQVHCPKCNKVERLELNFNKPEVKTGKMGSLPNVPIPNASNGLSTYSIAHVDHVLTLDIDANGHVRGEKIIERIDQGLEKTVAAIATKVFELYLLNNSKQKESVSFFFITQNKMIHKLLLGVFRDLIFNLPKGSDSLLSVKSDEALFEFDNLTVFVGNWQKKLYNFHGDSMVMVYEFNEHTYKQVELYMGQDLEQNITDTALMFDEGFLSSSTGKASISKIFKITAPQALDMSNPDRAARALFTIITSILSVKIPLA